MNEFSQQCFFCFQSLLRVATRMVSSTASPARNKTQRLPDVIHTQFLLLTNSFSKTSRHCFSQYVESKNSEFAMSTLLLQHNGSCIRFPEKKKRYKSHEFDYFSKVPQVLLMFRTTSRCTSNIFTHYHVKSSGKSWNIQTNPCD